MNGAEIFVDFAHTPDGLDKSLETLKPLCKGKLYCLFGCGGNRDRGKRAQMGAVAAKKADFSYLTSDNPRYEDPSDIIREIETGYRRFSENYAVLTDRKKSDFLRREISEKRGYSADRGKGRRRNAGNHGNQIRIRRRKDGGRGSRSAKTRRNGLKTNICAGKRTNYDRRKIFRKNG